LKELDEIMLKRILPLAQQACPSPLIAAQRNFIEEEFAAYSRKK
jgi:hypothetical protein